MIDTRNLTDEEMKAMSRGISQDMSPEAISRRLEIASQLFSLMQSLGRAKRIGPVNPDAGPVKMPEPETPAAEDNE